MTRHNVTNVEVAKIKVKLRSPFFLRRFPLRKRISIVLLYSTSHSRRSAVSRFDLGEFSEEKTGNNSKKLPSRHLRSETNVEALLCSNG